MVPKKTSGNHDYEQRKDNPIADVRIQEDVLRAHADIFVICTFAECESRIWEKLANQSECYVRPVLSQREGRVDLSTGV